MPDAVTDQVAEALPGLIELRRDLHENPELGFYETRTAGIIADRLGAAGISVKAEVGGTGVVGVLDSGRAGPTL
ncbi:MAG: amidohydrolase, partial [Chloroflexi bacterium]|nr:amidohydrolase [Chloroflexota bacterium]